MFKRLSRPCHEPGDSYFSLKKATIQQFEAAEMAMEDSRKAHGSVSDWSLSLGKNRDVGYPN
jgi:hypothetical protein